MNRTIVSIGVLTLAFAQPAPAATCTWTGGGSDSNWSTSANWNNCGGAHAVPIDGDSLVFPDAAARKNNNNNISGLGLQHLQLNGLNYSIGGNVISLGLGISVDTPVGDNNDLGPVLKLNVLLSAGAQVFQDNGSRPWRLDGSLNLAGFNLTINGTNNTNIVGNVSGVGGITKIGSGRLFLSGLSNSYAGTMMIYNGTVETRDDTALGLTGAGNGTVVNSGSSLVISDDITNAESFTIAGTGFNGGGALDNAPFFGSHVVNGDILLTSDSTIANSASGTTLTLAGVISGGYGVTKIGPGTVRLLNVNTYSGVTKVNSGTLQQDGEIGRIEIDDAGTLAGNGNFTDRIALGGGILAPGYGYQPQTMTGVNLLWSSGSMAFNLGRTATRSDSILLSQAFTRSFASGFAIQFDDASTPPAPGVTYPLITFASQSGFTVDSFSFSYAGTGPGASMDGTFSLTSTELRFTPTSVVSDLIFRDGAEPG